MKRQLEKARIEFVPFVCLECGQLQLMSDLARGNTPGNCNSCLCENIWIAGPEQKIKVTIFKSAVKSFAKGEK